MAYYKNREVQVESFIPVEYKVQVLHQDGSREVVNLQELTMSKREIVSFVKGETDRLKDEEGKFVTEETARNKLKKEEEDRVKREENEAVIRASKVLGPTPTPTTPTPVRKDSFPVVKTPFFGPKEVK